MDATSRTWRSGDGNLFGASRSWPRSVASTPVDASATRQLQAVMRDSLNLQRPSVPAPVHSATRRAERTRPLLPDGRIRPIARKRDSSSGEVASESWRNPITHHYGRTLVSIHSEEAPLLPHFDAHPRWRPRGRQTTLDFDREGNHIRKSVVPVRDPAETLARRAATFRAVPTIIKEAVVQAKAPREYESICASINVQQQYEMELAMSQPASPGTTGILRRPPPARAVASGPIRGADQLFSNTPTTSGTGWGVTETMAMSKTAAVMRPAFQPQFGRTGSLGFSMGGSATLSGFQVSPVAPGTTIRVPVRGSTLNSVTPFTETSERAEPLAARLSGTRGKLRLRAPYHEPTATAGLIAPVRRTRFTRA